VPSMGFLKWDLVGRLVTADERAVAHTLDHAKGAFNRRIGRPLRWRPVQNLPVSSYSQVNVLLCPLELSDYGSINNFLYTLGR
jgi:hypothetical protein